MDAYSIVLQARQSDRINAKEIIDHLCDYFIELHGDRLSGDDQAVVGGVGLVEDQAITIIGIQKGENLFDNMERNFGMARPAGYRKAQRLMRQAEKFNRPILTLINTAGADATPESENAGIGEAIAGSLKLMAQLTVPTLAIILGEGGSGGAIAFALSDEVWMLEKSIYSILSPEGFASILWKDSSLAPQAAEIMKLTAEDLLDLKVIDRIIQESAHTKKQLLEYLSVEIIKKFSSLKQISVQDRIIKRYDRFRKF
ncbi:acetyl-CoA carboxylase carboxyl transferase subunit alpha [Facklamia sp. DSM 111018]|uniref:acetyl-CoA carboxytransferase n=1 Tax=Facklamia lactis TaxID=2749967 RepID=A0ABS0LT32_9LACT|nr:carboxyltransferase subunit alpha [Facklamia lactis]MBG9981350.1 acetyl-CoA carboxylase carboxyl transferase subunit alpha [Facklamia lactis]MBG9987174.1 acetyl-CoA carboxylase carboxyl transferase subunit alpha [Facklamia lactis]